MSQPGVGVHGKPCCVAPGCSSIYRGEKEKMQGIRFHSFPLEDSRCNEWLCLLGLEGFRPRMSNMVCSLHFHPNSYRSTKVKKILKDDALPIKIDDSVKPTLLCLVQLCSSRSDRGGRYALFPFPTSHPDVCRQWMSFCSLREDRPLPRTAAVCARHFPPNQLVQAGGGRVHLRLGAVPAHYGPQVYNAHAMLTPPRSLQQQQQQQQGSPLKKSPAQGSVQFQAVRTVGGDVFRENFIKWKNGECRFQCKICDAICPNSLDFASHQRTSHGIDLPDYVRAHGNSRIRTAYVDCALCTESVMHDVSTFRRHLLVVHAGVTVDDYYARYVLPKMPKPVTQVVTSPAAVSPSPAPAPLPVVLAPAVQVAHVVEAPAVPVAAVPSNIHHLHQPSAEAPTAEDGSGAKRKRPRPMVATRASRRQKMQGPGSLNMPML